MDIFNIIEKRDAAPVKTAKKTVKRYFVCVGSCSQMRSRRSYDYAKARRIAARAKRFGLDAYVSSPFTVTV